MYLYSKSKIQVSKIPELSFCKKGFMESVVIELTGRKVNVVACVYRPPPTNVHLMNNLYPLSVNCHNFRVMYMFVVILI